MVVVLVVVVFVNVTRVIVSVISCTSFSKAFFGTLEMTSTCVRLKKEFSSTVRDFLDVVESISFAFRFTGTTGLISGFANHQRELIAINVKRKYSYVFLHWSLLVLVYALISRAVSIAPQPQFVSWPLVHHEHDDFVMLSILLLYGHRQSLFEKENVI